MRILIVEDEHKIANALKQGLESEKFAVDVAYNADDGQTFATTEDYDLIIMDRMLPGNKDGLEIIKALRTDNIHTPTIVLMVKGTIKDKVDGLDSGADDYLAKPFAFEELMARIRALLRRPQDSIGDLLKYEDLSLDTTTYQVVRAGKIIALSNKEYSLLEYLMRNADRIISRDSIISHVWNYDSNILPNTVDVYMGYLRSKIDTPFSESPNLLKTIRGFGYKFGVKNV